MSKSNTSPERNKRYMAAIANVRQRAGRLDETGIKALVTAINSANADAATVLDVDAIDPAFTRFAMLYCHKSGRPLPGVDPATIRTMVNAIGRDAAFERLAAQFRIACHPVWLHTDIRALSQNAKIDPVGFFVFTVCKLAGWDNGKSQPHYDHEDNAIQRGVIYDELARADLDAIVRCNELQRRLLALASVKSLEKLLAAQAHGILEKIAYGDTIELTDWQEFLGDVLAGIAGEQLRANYARYKEINRVLTAADIKAIRVSLGGSYLWNQVSSAGEDEAATEVLSTLRELGFTQDTTKMPVDREHLRTVTTGVAGRLHTNDGTVVSLTLASNSTTQQQNVPTWHKPVAIDIPAKPATVGFSLADIMRGANND